MAQLLLCFRPMRERRRSSGASNGTAVPDSGSTGTIDSRHTVAYVELLKHSAEPLGLALQGGKDVGAPIQVGVLRPGGVAAKSGALQVGDWILGINGTATQHLTHAEVNALLQNAGNVINLEIAFEAPPGSEVDDLKKTAQIKLPREGNSYGFTISGGKTENRPITVSNVTLDTTAYRKGFLKAGDRILKVNGVDLRQATQMETLSILRRSGETCTLEIQYDVTVHDVLTDPQGPLLVELLKPRGVSLGVRVCPSPEHGEPLRITGIREAGIADRCGALHIGDGIASVNGQSLQGKPLLEVYQMLRYCDLQVRLEIFPCGNQPEDAFTDIQSLVSHLPSFSSRLGRHSQLSLASTATSTNLTSHPETMVVSVQADEIGFGLSLQGGATEYINYPLTISSIEEGGPASRLGQLQVGDRILSINGIKVDSATLQQAVKLVQEAGSLIDLEIMFDIQDAIVPASGIFDVNLVKTASCNLGITINGSYHPGDPMWISRLKKGGIAYRTGMLHSGDVLLAIDGVSLENCILEEAARMLKNAGDTVSLRVSKENVMPQSETIIYSVELHRNQQSLGITLTGSRDLQGQPIIISKIKEEGVAYKTGTLKVGDRILAINGESLISTTLPEAVHMLSSAGDVVNLKIRKATTFTRSRRGRINSTGRLSRRSGGSARIHSSARMSRLEGQESYSRLLALRARRLSQTTTVSGRSTPDNHSIISMDSSYNGSVFDQVEPIGRENILGRLTPSEIGSAFSRPVSSASGVSSSRFPRYGHELDRSGQFLSTGGDRYYLPQYHPPGQTSSVGIQRRHRREIERSFLSKQDSLPEADEIMSQSWEESVSKYRRPSLPVHPVAGKTWNFKSRRPTVPAQRLPIPVGRVSPLTPADSGHQNSNFADKLDSLNGELKKVNLVEEDPDRQYFPTSEVFKPPSVSTPTEAMRINTQESTEDEDSSTINVAQVSEGLKPEGEVFSGGTNCEDVENDRFAADYSDDSDGRSQIAPSNTEVGLSVPTALSHADSASCTSLQQVDGEANTISPPVDSDEGDAGNKFEKSTSASPLTGHSPHTNGAVNIITASMRCSPHTTDSIDERNSPLIQKTIELPVEKSSPHSCMLKSPASPHMLRSVEVPVERSSPHMQKAVDIVTPPAKRKSPYTMSTRDKSRSPRRKNSSTSLEVAEINGHRLPCKFTDTQTSPTAFPIKQLHREKSATDVVRKSSNPIQTLKPTPSFEPTPSFGDFQRTIEKANEFELVMRALAESGSSDQDSDTETHGAKPDSVSAIEQEKIQEKMKTTIPPNQLKVHRIVLKRRPGASYGFSLADAVYEPGIHVKAVNVGSPADNAGVQPYDILLKIDGTTLQGDHNCKKINPILKQCGNQLELILARKRQVSCGDSYC